MQLGYANPDAMLAEMSPAHLGEWLAYYRINPWGEQRADLRMGVLAALYANAHRDARQRPEPFGAADFMPQFDRQDRDDEKRKRDALTAKARAVFYALPGRKKG